MTSNLSKYSVDLTTKEVPKAKKISPNFWWAMLILLGGLVAANIFYYQAYTLENTVKPLATIALGWIAYLFIFKKAAIKLPRSLENIEHLIGVMSLTLVFFFWILWTQVQFSI